MTLVFSAAFFLLMAYAVRRLGTKRVERAPSSRKEVFAVISFFMVFLTAFLIVVVIVGISAEGLARLEPVRDKNGLSLANGFFMTQATVSKNSKKRPRPFAAYDGDGSTGLRELTVSLADKDVLISNDNYACIWWPDRTDGATSRASLAVGDLIVILGTLEEHSKPPRIQGHSVIFGSLSDARWYVRSRMVFPSVFALLLILVAMGNLLYTRRALTGAAKPGAAPKKGKSRKKKTKAKKN